MEKLAIVIPFYKSEFFETCLFSISQQTNKNFKVYIGNDNSPIDPLPIIKKYEDEIDIKYKKFETNLGHHSLVKHWKRCLDLVGDEEWIMILGDDDKLGPECIEQFEMHQKEVRDLNIKVVRYATIKIDENDRETSSIFLHPPIESSLKFIFRKMRGETRSSLSEYIFEKDIVRTIEFKELPLAWHTDDLALLEMSQLGDIFTINSATVYFRNSGLNISTLTSNLRKKNFASFLYYHRIIKQFSVYLNEEERSILFKKLEKTFLNDKKKAAFYWKYFELRRENFKLKDFVSFAKEYFFSIINRKPNKRNFLK